MTNGSLILYPNGDQVRVMHIRDGYAIQNAISEGFLVVVISGGKSDGVIKRLEYLGIKEIHTGIKDKSTTFKRICKQYKLEVKETLYMGDDYPDLETMKIAGLSCCPFDAAHEIREISDYVSAFKGGEGCVRDVIEQTLAVQDKWNK